MNFTDSTLGRTWYVWISPGKYYFKVFFSWYEIKKFGI